MTMREIGHAGGAVPHAEVREFAIAAAGAVITLNRRHFVRLHDTRPAHAGIVVCSFDPDFAALARRIDEAVEPYADLAGTLILVNRTP
jgi:hypothetical protein